MSHNPMRFMLERLHRLGGNPRPVSGEGHKALCPAHDDHNPSLSVKRGDDGRVLVHCHAGCSTESVVDALSLTMADLAPPSDECHGRAVKRKPKPVPAKSGKVYPSIEAAAFSLAYAIGGELVGNWPYYDGSNREVMRVLRFDRPDGKKEYRPIHLADDGWRVNDPPGKLLLYRLPELIGARTVYLCEGEKAADAARSLGLVATTTAHGAKSVDKSDLAPLRGKDVVILPDNDEPGRVYAQAIASVVSRMDGQTTAKIVTLPDLPDGGDIVEFIEDRTGEGKDIAAIKAEIEALAEQTELFGESSGMMLTCLADVESKPLDWLWPNRIVLGKLNTLAGDPGLGKSFITMDIAARVSTGKAWPDQPDAKAPLGDVLLLTAEDGLDDTIRPRLDAAGADVLRIHAITAVQDPGKPEMMFNLASDIQRLATELKRRPNVRLIIIDPITAYLGKTDSYKDSEVRGLLSPLSKLAERHNVAVLMVQHLNKSSGSNAQHRISGSVAFPAASRAVWQIFKDKDDSKRRLMLLTKMNIAAEPMGLAYSLIDSIPSGIGTVRWEKDPVELTADDAVGSSGDGSDAANDRDDATDWLNEVLDHGPVLATELQAWVKDQPFSWATVKRAKAKAGIQTKREGFGKGSKSYWRRPEP